MDYWQDELPEVNWSYYDLPKDLLVKAGWCANSIALGSAIAQGLRWEEYGSTWAIRDGEIVEAADRT